IEALDPEAVLSVARVSLHDASTGTSAPLSALPSLLEAQPGWRPLCATMGDTIYENRDALPRAWLVRRVVPASPPDALAAVHGGRGARGARARRSCAARPGPRRGRPPCRARVPAALVRLRHGALRDGGRGPGLRGPRRAPPGLAAAGRGRALARGVAGGGGRP